jgi:hypothetical protein
MTGLPLSSGLSGRLRFVAHPNSEQLVCRECCGKVHDPTPTNAQHVRATGRSTRRPVQGVTRSPLLADQPVGAHIFIRFNVLLCYPWSVSVMIALVLETGGILGIMLRCGGVFYRETLHRLTPCLADPSHPLAPFKSFGRLRHGCCGLPLGIRGSFCIVRDGIAAIHM